MEKNAMISIEINHEMIPDSSEFTNMVNDKYYKEYLIDDLYKRAYNNLGHFELNKFQILCSKFIDDSFGKSIFEDYKELDFISFFKDLETDINLESKDEIMELTLILKISSILLEKARKDNNESLLHESIYQVKSRLRNSKIINQNQKVCNDRLIITKQDCDKFHVSLNNDEKVINKLASIDFPFDYKGIAYE